MVKIPTTKDYRQRAMFKKEFLEKYPLYKWHELEQFSQVSSLKYSSSVTQYCPNCQSEQTFTVKDYDEAEWMRGPTTRIQSFKAVYQGQSLKLNYECKGCHTFPMTFTIQFSDDGAKVRKIGQSPAFSIQPKKELQNFLGEYVDLYKKGLICESQSYGIGAFSYYRRIVEIEIGRLLTDIEKQVQPDDIEEFKKAFDEVKNSHYAKDKIDIISKVIPSHLKPGGANPLGILYRTLSEGIHGMTDEECLDKATATREILESFIYLLNVNSEAIQRLAKNTKTLLSGNEK